VEDYDGKRKQVYLTKLENNTKAKWMEGRTLIDYTRNIENVKC